MNKIIKSVLCSLVIEDVLEGTVSVLKDTYGNMGYTNIQAELSKAIIEDKEFTCFVRDWRN